MPRFTDENQVVWDIRLTSVQVDQGAANASWVAGVADDSARNYAGNKFPLVDEETFPAGTVITWPADGNPILRGAGDEKNALAAVKAFARRDLQKPQNARALGLRVGERPDAATAGMPWWAWVAAFYAGYRLIKRSTAGRSYRG